MPVILMLFLAAMVIGGSLLAYSGLRRWLKGERRRAKWLTGEDR